MRTDYAIVSNEDYHNEKDIPSRSLLSEALKSPAHLRKAIEGVKEYTDSMNLGTFIHDYIQTMLNLNQNFQNWERRNEYYKRATEKNNVGDLKSWSFINKTDSEQSLTPAKSELALAITQSCLDAMDTKGSLLNSLFSMSDMVAEPTYYGIIDGLQVKTRPDIACIKDDTLVEIKTTKNLDPDSLARDFFDLDYDMQAYMELELTGAEKIVYLLVGTNDPVGFGSFVIDRNSPYFATGKEKTLKAIELYKKNKDSKDTFYDVGSIDLPVSYRAADFMAKNGVE